MTLLIYAPDCIFFILFSLISRFHSQTNEKMFLRKIKFDNNKTKTKSFGTFTTDDEYFLSTSGPFVRFLNEFEGQKSLFRKEGIEFNSKKYILYNRHNIILYNII